MESPKNDGVDRRKARGRPRDWGDASAKRVKSLDRAMAILDHLSDQSGISLSALSADLDQSPATVYRVLLTLEDRGLAEFDPAEQLWHIGARAFVIGARYLRRTSLVERARPILRRLMEDTGETANLGIERGGHVLFLSQVETHESIRAFFPPGTLSQMHASGIGKALLAQMDADRFDRWFAEHPPERFTDYTLLDRDELIEALAEIRQRGFSIDGEEKNIGMRCIAAPVFDVNREPIAGISVSGPVSRVGTNAIDRLSRSVINAASELTKAIGGEVAPQVI